MSADRKTLLFGVLFVALGLANLAVALSHHPVAIVRVLMGAGFLIGGITKLWSRRARA